jgi:sodium transport system permease protein
MSERRPTTGGWPARLALARRDLLEFVRDRRALVITLLMPMAMYPLLALSSTLGIRSAVGEIERAARTRQLDIALSGPDAEGLAARIGAIATRDGDRPAGWPEGVTIRIVDEAAGPTLLDAGRVDAWIDVERGTLSGLTAAGTVTLEPRLSTVRPPDRRVKELVLAVLKGVADQVGLERLRRAGLPPSLVEPIRVEFIGDLDPGRAAEVRGLVPIAVAAVLVLLALLTATGAFYPAIDALAGEKERGTIETLLMSPCGTFDVVFGKFLAVFAVTLATLLANVISITATSAVLLRVLPPGTVAALPAGGAAACVTVTLVAYVGLAAVAAALCLAVTAASRSAKEAQNTLTPVVMLIAALAASALLPTATANGWLAAVPFAGQVAVSKSMLAVFLEDAAVGGDAAPAGANVVAGLVVSLVGSAVAAWLLILLTASLVANEEILFRGPAAATRGLRRPPPRALPSPGQAFAAAVMGVAALWYAQGLAPREFVAALISQQAVAVLLPLLAISWWQRIDATGTFALRWPAPTATGGWAAVVAASLIGGGLFGVGAAATLAIRGGVASEEAADLARRLVSVIRDGPAWSAVLLLAVMPAVCEELLFRGWMLAGFAGPAPSRRRAWAAIAAQAAAFAGFHLLPERMPQTFVLGLVTGWMTLATRSLLPAIVAHAVHNATPVVLIALASADELDAVAAGQAAALPAWIVAAAIGCLVAGGLLLAVTRHGCWRNDAWTTPGE